MNELLLALALGAGALSNFPRDAGGRISQPAVGLHAGGAAVVAVAAGERVVGYRGDGAMAPGFPFSLGAGEAAAGAPAAAGDELAVVTTSGKLFLWSGRVLPGFPVSLGARAKAGPSFADVDGDGKLEVVVGDERGRLHAFARSGREAKGFPRSVARAAVTSTVSSANFAGGLTLAFGCEDGKVHAVDVSGRERPGFPLSTAFAVTGAPAFADLDDDGELDLVATSQDFAAYAVNRRGEALPGFPVRAGYRIYDGAAIADLDGDGRLDVVFASADGWVHAVDRTGKELAGFPVRAGQRIFGGPVVGDLDRDGSPDVAVVAADGTVAAWSGAGRPLAGFPSPIDGSDVGATALLFDLAGDSTLSLFVGVPSGELFAVRAPRAGTAAAATPWPGAGHDGAHSGRYGPNPPTYKDLKLSPAAPRVAEALVASWRGVWLDAAPGEAAPAPRIEWLRNGRPVAGLDGKRELPPGTARRGERWRFVLTGPGGASVAESPEVRVQDSAPGAAVVALDPAAPSRAAPVRAVVRKEAPDADGDAITYRVEWLQDGLDTGVVGDTFPADRLRRGALLTARVVASDGELEAAPVEVTATVGDTAPGELAVSLEPQAPRRTDAIRVHVERPAVDLDGDRLVYRHRWKVDGVRRPVPPSSPELPAGLARKRQKVQVEVRAWDGELEGPPATAEVVVRNTPPTAPRVEIRPARPRKGEALRAVLVAPAEDADRDALTYRWEWRKNGAPLAVTGDPREVPGSEVARGDRFEVVAWASDGEAEGPKAQAAVSVANTPPVPPRIAIEPLHPRGGDALRAVVLEPARDADGEPVTLSWAWTRDGKPTGNGADRLAPDGFRKHERVRVTVTPRDSEESGAPAVFEVVADDAPPTAPELALPAKPTVAAPLAVTIAKLATDPDGDRLTYRYRWLRNGAPVAVPDGTEASRAEPFWTSRAEVPASELAKGQAWVVEAQAWDGEAYGPVARATTTIANAPPPPPRIAFAPERPRRVDGLSLSISQPRDPDGDPITYRYAWTRNGERYPTPPEQSFVARGVPRRGERWAVEVVATDGEAEAKPVRIETVVADTPPGPAGVALCDGPVPSGTVPQARITWAATDPDGDAVSYRYDWSLNGKPLPAASGAVKLAAPALRKHDRVRVVVTPTDGELAGPPASGECLVEDTPPTAPVAALVPAEPTAGTGVAVQLRKPSADRDGDPVTYRYAWTRDGVATQQEGATIPPNVLHHGEVWRVEVTPWDGEAAGEPVVLATVVANTRPPAPTVAVAPEAPTAGVALTCDARAPDRDLDREPVAVRYRWLLDGVPQAIADGMAQVPAGIVRRGEKWRCEAWATDGFAESARASAEVLVRDSPPGPAKVVVEPEKPRTRDDLVCAIAVESADADGDPVAYAYSWTRNGRPAQATAGDPTRIEAARTAKGERWRCTVTPSDGTLSGPSASAERIVADTPPGPARVAILPAAPRSGQPLRCEIVGRSTDPDGDAVRYRFGWQRNGAPQPFAESSQEVPARLVKAGDRWRCVVVPNDGEADGPEAGTEEVLVGASVDSADAR